MSDTVTVNDVLDGHAALDVECLDRVYLNGYVPNLQVAGQVVSFLTRHLGYPIPSPAIFAKLGKAFRAAVDTFAAQQQVPVVRFGKGDRKVDVMRPYLAKRAATGESGVAAIGIAQEFQNVFDASRKDAPNGVPVLLLQGRPAGDLLLLLPVRRRVRSAFESSSRVPRQAVEASRSRSESRECR